MIGSLSGLNFPIQTAEMDHLYYNACLKKNVLNEVYEVGAVQSIK